VQKQLKLRVRGAAEEEWLARFVRTLEVGRRRARRWHLRSLDHGWEARSDLADRTERLTLVRSDEDWTLTVESGPPERAPSRLNEWLLGVALGLAALSMLRSRWGVVAAVALLLGCGLFLPRLAWRIPVVTPGDDPDPVDEELLERVRRGAESFAGFELITPEWGEPELP
jgi:hypothetical protein